MDHANLRAFLGWCTIINGVLLALSILGIAVIPEMATTVHSRLFQLSQAAVSETLYFLLGMYKLLWLSLNLVPYAAMRIISKEA